MTLRRVPADNAPHDDAFHWRPARKVNYDTVSSVPPDNAPHTIKNALWTNNVHRTPAFQALKLKHTLHNVCAKLKVQQKCKCTKCVLSLQICTSCIRVSPLYISQCIAHHNNCHCSALTPLHSALSSLHSALTSLHSALTSLHSAQCTHLIAQCSHSTAQCN